MDTSGRGRPSLRSLGLATLLLWASISPSVSWGDLESWVQVAAPTPARFPSPSRPRRATRLESHGHGPPPGLSSAPAPGGPWKRSLGPHLGVREEAGEAGGRWPALALLQPAPRLPAAPAPLPPPRPLPAPPPPRHASGTPRREAAFAPDRGIQAPGRVCQAGFSTRLSPGRPSGLETRQARLPRRPGKNSAAFPNGTCGSTSVDPAPFGNQVGPRQQEQVQSRRRPERSASLSRGAPSPGASPPLHRGETEAR